MKNVLVLGGSRFFGKALVERLIDFGCHVAIATRGQAKDLFGSRVDRLVVDRRDPESLKLALKNKDFDLVFDNICYNDEEAEYLCRAIPKTVEKIVFTSSMAVYGPGRLLDEALFVPEEYRLEPFSEALDYGEGKRRAEAYYAQHAPVPYTAVRFPVVLGEEDYTERLLSYGKQVASQTELANPEGDMCFISSDEAARFLCWCGQHDITGPINACSDGTISIQNIISYYGEKIDVPVRVGVEGSEGAYHTYTNYILSNSYAESKGFTFNQLDSYIYPLMDRYIKEITGQGK
ncbi:NAD-dependent epimerase/dehydratase family protein [Bacillus sp. 1P06AnD]|uniref:NAD-dependent epimerase/dehydratase family protein n=1 Tax=Bacillus sp. 1P06AnD TaxID=3132208 RepID=UPI0039A0FD5D